MGNILITDIIQQLKNLENSELWIDENFEKKLSGVNATAAFVRPIAGLHSVAEIISHLVEWRREVLSRLAGNPAGLKMDDTANWRSNDELKEKGWNNLLRDFYKSQQHIIAFLQGKDDSYLFTPYPFANHSFQYDFKYMTTGLIHHDLYHLGQIGIIIKFLNECK